MGISLPRSDQRQTQPKPFDASRSAYNWWANVAELVRYIKRCPNPNAHKILELAEKVVDGNRARRQRIEASRR